MTEPTTPGGATAMSGSGTASGAPDPGPAAAGAPPFAAPPPPAAPVQPVPPVRPPWDAGDLGGLARSRSDRVIAGVCGGIAARLGVDPVLVRVVVAALTLFAGAGLLLYTLGWLLLPEEGTGTSVLDRAVGRGPAGSRGSALALAAALLIAAILFAALFLGAGPDGPLLLVLAIVAVVLLLRRRRPELAGGAGGAGAAALGGSYGPPPATAPYGPPAGTPAYGPPAGTPGYGPPPGAAASVAASSATGESPTVALPTDDPTRPVPPVGSGEPTQVPGPPPAWYAAPPAPPVPPARPVWPDPPPPPRPRERSALLGVTLSAALVAIGVLVLVDSTDADVLAASYVAVPLAVVAAGLLVGTWFGRSRALVVIGLLLTVALPPAVAIDEIGPFDGEGGDVRVVARTIEQGTGTRDYGAGEVRYDLSGLDFTGRDEELRIESGVGLIEVVLPADVDVVVQASAGAGSLRILDQNEVGGVSIDADVRDVGDDGPGGGDLRLELEIGIGDVEVTRAAA